MKLKENVVDKAIAKKLQRVIDTADTNHDGHLTLFRFTTGWKGALGTEVPGRKPIRDQPERMSLDSLLDYLLENNG